MLAEGPQKEYRTVFLPCLPHILALSRESFLAAVAGTKKVMVEDTFAMLLSVYTPSAPAELISHLQSPATSSKLGFSLTASLLDPDRPVDLSLPVTSEAATPSGERRRFKLSYPQQPGIVLALTEVLKDFDCKMSHIDADTLARGSEIWFEIAAVVDVPAGVNVTEVEDALRFWTQTKDQRTKLIFDKHTHSFSPLSHA